MKLKTLIYLMTFAWRMGYERGKGDQTPPEVLCMQVIGPSNDTERNLIEDGGDVGVMLAKLATSNDWRIE
ncbi:hypothetical protein [Burkholderia arboris]|uniref:hypothetical protein n=1 Tax=Burkholderia arboris TaxID=488730 RepID=UPI00210C608A|nr:hypothetical protein [Burkholderia arboris]UTV53225.1 hypothetical protein NLX30_10005 [Burkholderia arboris]